MSFLIKFSELCIFSDGKIANFIDFDAPKRAKVKKRYITFFRNYPLFLYFPKNGIPSLLPLYPVLILASMDILILTPSFSLKMNVCNIFPFFSIFKQLLFIQQQIDVRDHKRKKENRLFINFTKQTVAST